MPAAGKGSEAVRWRLDVFHAQVDFGLSAMVRCLREAVPQGLERADLRALILVHSVIELVRRNRLNFTDTLVVRVVEELQCHLLAVALGHGKWLGSRCVGTVV